MAKKMKRSRSRSSDETRTSDKVSGVRAQAQAHPNPTQAEIDCRLLAVVVCYPPHHHIHSIHSIHYTTYHSSSRVKSLFLSLPTMATPPADGAPAAQQRSYLCFVRYENNTHSIALPGPNMLVSELKRELAAHREIRVPVAQQQIIRSGTLMLDDQRLSDFQLMQSTVLHLIRRRVDADTPTRRPPDEANAERTQLAWDRPSYVALPIVHHNLPAIARDVFESNKFFVWCTACTAPCFPLPPAASSASSSLQQRYQPGVEHSPRCTSLEECLALSRHRSIGVDCHGVPYPQELQPASARPRCSRCKSGAVNVAERQIQWDQVFSRSAQGECLDCHASGAIIEHTFVCRGELARKSIFDGDQARSVCRSLSVDGLNLPLPNVYQQASRACLDGAAAVAELVAERARSAIAAATGAAVVSVATVQEAVLAASAAARSIDAAQPDVLATVGAESRRAAAQLEVLFHALQANNHRPLAADHAAVSDLTAAATRCHEAAAAARAAPLIDSSDSGSPDSMQLEFHGCTGARRPHRLNANGLGSYIAAQRSLRSVMVRNEQLPHFFGAYVIRCCEPGCAGILYLPSCRLAGPERYEVIRNWATSELALQQGGVLCPLPNHRGDPAYLPPADEPGPCRHCPTCREYFCEQHRTAWRSCLHNLDVDAMARHAINEALTEGAVQQCPKCRALVQRSSATCTAMTCSICQAKWCYFCAREVASFRDHNRDWESNATHCPRFLDEHPLLAGTPIESVALFHRLKTLRLLREARRTVDQRVPGRFDAIFATLEAFLFTVEAQQIRDGSDVPDSATAPPITLADVQQPHQETGVLYAMP